MVKKIIDVGIQGNDATGDAIRDAFSKTNENFTELYAALGNAGGLSFTGLTQTPNTLVPNNILITNPTGTTLLQKELVAGYGMSIEVNGEDPTQIVITNTGASLSSDPAPALGANLNAGSLMIYGLPDPSQYNQIQTDLGVPSQDNFVISKKYGDQKYLNVSGDRATGALRVRDEPLSAPTTDPDYDATLTGNYLKTEAIQRQDAVYRGGDEMTGPLLLDADPTSASNPLTAATKHYVDTSSFTSQVNFFVSTAGDDIQANIIEEKKGRALAYAFRSINQACLAAERVQATAKVQLGPYQKVVTYTHSNATVNSTIDAVTPTGTPGYYYLDITHDGHGTDPRNGANYDIRAGLLFRGILSGAIAFIDNVGEIGASTERYTVHYVNEYQFRTGEGLEYGDSVKARQIVIHVESGEYYEQYPIRVPENVSIVGDELRRVIVRPKVGASSSKWSDIYFRRDITMDGLTLVDPVSIQSFVVGQTYTIADLGLTTNTEWNTVAGTTGKIYSVGDTLTASTTGSGLGDGTAYCPYGYHYLTDPSRSFYSKEITNAGGFTNAQKILNANREFIRAETVGWTNENFKVIITGSQSTTNTFICESNENLNSGMPIRFSPISTFVTHTDMETNYITVISSMGMMAGQTIEFTGDSIGGLLTGTTYYVRSVINDTTITISDSYPGPVNIITATESGLMTANITTELFGGILPDTTYYVKDIIGLTQFTISATINGISPGTVKNLTDSVEGEITMKSNFYYNQITCSRDIGLIVDAIGYDLIYGDYYKSSEAAMSYYSNVSGLIAIGYQLVQTIAAIEYMKSLAMLVLDQTEPDNSYQYSMDPIMQEMDFAYLAEPDASTAVNDLVMLMTDVISNDVSVNLPKENNQLDVFLLNNATILRMFTCQGHGGFMCVLDPEGQILNKSPFVEICASFSQSINQQRFAGGLFVDGFTGNLLCKVSTRVNDTTVIVQSDALKIRAPQTPCSFYIYGYRYEVDYVSNYNQSAGTVQLNLNSNTPDNDGYTNRGNLIIENGKIELNSAGNRSVVTTHYTQVNDLGYSLVATNNALIEAVSIFTYYCYRALYSVNGAQIRSLNGSNSYGTYGIAAEGSDPTEVPAPGNLYYPMTQIAYVYRQGVFSATGVLKGLAFVVSGYQYVPFDLSMVEIDHNGVITNYEVSTTGTTTINGVIQLNLSTSGNNNTATAGLVADLVDGQPVIIRNMQNFRFNNILNTAPTRPSTALTFNGEEDIYRILSYNLGNMPSQEAILGSTIVYNYVGIITDASAGILPGTGQVGDTKANILGLTTYDATRVIGKSFAWGNTTHIVIGYESPTTTGQTWARITFDTPLSKSLLNGLGSFSISSVSRVGPLTTQSFSRVGPLVISTVSRVGASIILSVARNSSSVATVITTDVHGLVTGNVVNITGTTFTGFDQTGVTITRVNDTTFTYSNAGSSTGVLTTPVTAIATLASPIATITTVGSHGLTTGDVVTVSATAITGFDAVSVTITSTGLTTFTYSNNGNTVDTTSATAGRVSTITSNFATVTTTTPHYLTTGDLVTISGTTTLGYDATNVAVTVTGSSTFKYVNSGETQTTTVFSASVITPASNIATVTTSTAHGLSTLNYVSIVGTGYIDAEGVKILSTSTYGFTCTNVGTNLSTTPVTSSTVTSGGTKTLRAGMNNFRSIKINSVSRDSSNIATIITKDPHKLITGRTINLLGITITGNASPGFNASGVSITVVNEYTFTYANTGALLPSTTALTGAMQLATQLTISTISRTSNISTITTSAPHGLLQDDTFSVINTDFEIITSGTSASTDAITISKISSDGGLTYTTTNTTTGLIVGMPIVFGAVGNAGTGITSGTTYYIKTIYSSTSITISDTPPTGAFVLLQLNTTSQVGSATVGYNFGVLNVNVLKVLSPTSFIYTNADSAHSAVAFSLARVVPVLPTPALVTVYISLTRCTGHDFLQIGTGGFADTNYPNNIFGASNNSPTQAQEVVEIGRGRCFYVSTDQYGNFRVGSFFKVDQGTGTVTFAASIALSNLDGIGFKRGVTVAEFSTDDTMTNNATDTVPVQSALRSYIDKRLGITQTNGSPVPVPIGPGFFPRNGSLPATANFNMSGFNILNLASPSDLTDAANKDYVDSLRTYVDTFFKRSGGTRTGIDSFTMGASPSGYIDMNSNRIRNVATPTVSTDAVNKSYVDGMIDGVNALSELIDTSILTTTNITISSFTSKTGSGPYLVVYAIPSQTSAPTTGISYTVSGNSTALYNGTFLATASTTTSITLSYTNDPGTYGSGITTLATSGITSGDLLVYNGTKWVNAAQSGSITTALTSYTISQISRNSNIATIVTSAAHGLLTNDKVTIPSVLINSNIYPGFRGTASITRIDNVSFSYVNVGSNISTANALTGTITAVTVLGNFVSISSTTSMVVGTPIQFTGSTLGNLATNTTYWIKSILSQVAIPIAEVARSGSTVTVTTGGAPFNLNSFTSKTGSGPYLVTFGISTQATAPQTGIIYLVSGNGNTSYNGSYTATASTTTSITLSYASDPGTFGSGLTTAQYLSTHGLVDGQVVTVTGTSLVDQANVTISYINGTQFSYNSTASGTIVGTTVTGSATPQPQITLSSSLGGSTLSLTTPYYSATAAPAATGTGPYIVQFTIPTQPSAPLTGIAYIVSGNTNTNFNGTFIATASTTTSISMSYASNPGTFSTATATTLTQTIATGSMAFTAGVVGTVQVFSNRLASSTIVDSMVSASANIAQSKLNLDKATATTNASGDAVTFGIAGFNSANFSASSGFISLKAGGISLSYLATIPNYTVLGNISGTSNQVNTITIGSTNANNTIVYRGDAGEIAVGALTASGATYLATSTGSVGIGTNSPTAKLHVSGTGASNSRINIESTGTAGGQAPGLNFIRSSSTLATVGIQGVISWVTTLTDSTTISSSISATGSNNAASASSSFNYSAFTSHIFQISNVSKITFDSTGNIIPSNNNTQNLGSASYYWNTVYGNATSANYADLAENYEGDQEYEFGTVVMIGGEKEVTLAKGIGTTKVAGVVSEKPAHLMNAGCPGIKVPVALQGRVPCKVVGNISKGDLLIVSLIPGVAMVGTDPKPGSIIGKALADYSSDRIGIIEVLVGKH